MNQSIYVFLALFALKFLSDLALNLLSEIIPITLNVERKKNIRRLLFSIISLILLLSLVVDIYGYTKGKNLDDSSSVEIDIREINVTGQISVSWSSIPDEGPLYLVRSDGYRYYEFKPITKEPGERHFPYDKNMQEIAIVKIRGSEPISGSVDINDPKVVLIASRKIDY